MKFKTVEDVKLFLLEISKEDLLESVDSNFEPTSDMVELFIKRRRVLLTRMKDFRKSQQQKANWRRYRYKYLKGIRSFHKSTKGKRFHRNLGRFLATRIFNKGRLSSFEAGEALKSLNSAKTHAFIELEYYFPILSEEVDYHLFLEELIKVASRVEKFLLSESSLLCIDKADLSDDDFEFLLRLVETSALIKSFADKTGRSVEEVEKLWNKAKEIVKKEYKKSEEDSDFYRLVVGVLKKMLGGK